MKYKKPSETPDASVEVGVEKDAVDGFSYGVLERVTVLSPCGPRIRESIPVASHDVRNEARVAAGETEQSTIRHSITRLKRREESESGGKWESGKVGKCDQCIILPKIKATH